MRVIGYMVTAVKEGDFRRVGRTFKTGVATKVDLSSLTTLQAEFLAGSNPKQLKVEPIFEAPPAEQSAPAPVAPCDPEEEKVPGGIATSPSGVEDAPPEPTKRGRGK